MRVRRPILSVVFLAIVVGVVFFPDWERWEGKPDQALMRAVQAGVSSEAFGVELQRRLEESLEFRALMREWYFAMVESGDVESRGRVWMWDGVIWGEGDLKDATEERLEKSEDAVARRRLLVAYLGAGGVDVMFLVGQLGDEAVGVTAARWLVENGRVPEVERGRVAGVLAGEADAGMREAMADFYAGGVLEKEVYTGWLERVILVVEG